MEGDDRVDDRTFSFLKADGQKYRILTDYLEMLTDAGGLELAAFKIVPVTQELLNRHYEDYIGEPYFEPMCNSLIRAEVVPVMIIKGHNAVSRVRDILGATRPWEAAKGTLRRRWGEIIPDPDAKFILNVAHASDSRENAEREIGIWLPQHA